MHPVLIEIGPISIRYYGLMYVLGIIIAIFLVRSEVRRKGLPLSDDDQTNLLLFTVLAGIIGARLYYVVFNWPYYRQFPWEIPAVWRGGLAFHGGALGGICAVLWFAQRKAIPLLRLTDVLAPPLILGQALGRFGNFMNGDAHGVPTSLPWGVVFAPNTPAGAEFPNIPLHPTMLYEMAINLGIFAYLWSTRTRPAKDGYTTMRYLLLYSLGRFGVEFLRADSLWFGPFRAAQLVSLALIVFSTTLIVKWRLWRPTNSVRQPVRKMA
ncbi:MAG TPA: prolipoprotein diacylglyceryl transferase [Alphaproteobacteria bacterium]|nr:prolipoprotein diacylglyceryl transferase [Alphaproteobacteria bacterium]